MVSSKNKQAMYDYSPGQVEASQPLKLPLNGASKATGNGIVESNGDNVRKDDVSDNSMIQTDVENVKISPSTDRQFEEIARDYVNLEESGCGLGSFRPSWLQALANKNMFLLVFSVTCLLQGMYYTYFASILTTIEKLYHIQSKTTGIIMSATEIGQISSALLLTYYGSRGHRPKWISCGILIFVLACFLCTTPHFIYKQEILETMKKPVQSRSTMYSFNMTRAASENFNTCLRKTKHSNNNSSSVDISTSCSDKEENIINEDRQKMHIVLVLLFISLLMIGTGYTAVQTLGIPYIDDNVAPRESPLYFGMTMGVKIFGPVLGFMLGSLCTSIYVHPFDNPGLTSKDHAWVGAWWLGILLIAVSLLVVAFPMMSFPRKLHVPNVKPNEGNSSKNHSMDGSHNGNASQKSRQLIRPSVRLKRRQDTAKLREFPKVMHRLLKNKILIWRTASSVLHILPIAGLYTFMPKYLESQFRLTAAKASMTAGLAGMLVMGVGIFMSSLYMRKYKPTAKFVAGWIALTALAYSIGMAILSFVGCNSPSDFGGNMQRSTEMMPDGSYDICNRTCLCDPSAFSPVCSSNGVTYASPCHAGCSLAFNNGSNQLSYGDCSCVGVNVTVTEGLCDLNCNNIIWYILIFTTFVFIHSTSEVGMMLLTLRCVDPEDKTMALGLITFSIGLFGNVPCPIIYGAVVDSTCQFWEDKCGQVGACRMYESHMFRKLFHGITAALMFMAFLVDVVVWMKAGSINFREYEPSEDKEASLPINCEPGTDEVKDSETTV